MGSLRSLVIGSPSPLVGEDQGEGVIKLMSEANPSNSKLSTQNSKLFIIKFQRDHP